MLNKMTVSTLLIDYRSV